MMSGDELESFQDLLDECDITHWDYVLVGDGSGSHWGQQAGWACVSVERATMERLVWAGAVNRGTVNLAEIMAYLQPLTYFVGREEDRRKAGGKTCAYNVHIVTDSEYCRNTGRTRSAMMSKNAGLWACLNGMSRQGMVITWHWLRRDMCALNRFCDELSRLSRQMITEFDPAGKMEAAGNMVYDLNPTDDE